MAGDTFGKFKDSFNRGIASIGAKASNSVEKSNLKRQLEAYNKEAEALIAELGRKAYGMWNSGSADFESLESDFQAIKAKYEAVQATFTELKAIEEREAMANQPAPVPTYAQPQPVVPMYGAPNQVTPPVVPVAAPVVPVQAPVEPVAPIAPIAPVEAPAVPVAAPVVPAQPVAGCVCPNCGARFDTAINFCRMCGTKIAK